MRVHRCVLCSGCRRCSSARTTASSWPLPPMPRAGQLGVVVLPVHRCSNLAPADAGRGERRPPGLLMEDLASSSS
ncbi:hypothetical protein ACP70R_022607 [Stipagrostis hirtigluma subsp. patula]